MSALPLLAAAAMFFAAPAFAEEDTLTIGMTLSQTGSLNVDSVAQQGGAELWRDQVNEAGGLKGGDKRNKLRYVTYDEQTPGGRVQQLYTRLIVQDKAQFLFSPYSSGLCATAAVITEQYGRLVLINRRGGAEDLYARQQVSGPGDHLGRPLPQRRHRRAPIEERACQGGVRLLRRSVLQR